MFEDVTLLSLRSLCEMNLRNQGFQIHQELAASTGYLWSHSMHTDIKKTPYINKTMLCYHELVGGPYSYDNDDNDDNDKER